MLGGRLEVNSFAYFDNQTVFYGGLFIYHPSLYFGGASAGTANRFYMDLTSDQTTLALNSSLGRQLVITDILNTIKDHDHAVPTNPTLFVHSVIDPDDDNTQWLSLTHNQKNAELGVGLGHIKISDGSDGYATLQTGGLIKNYTQVTASTYTTTKTDYYIGCQRTADGTCAITLLTDSVFPGRTVIILDEGRLAGSNTITIDTEGSELINHAITATITSNGGSVKLVSNGVDWYSW